MLGMRIAQKVRGVAVAVGARFAEGTEPLGAASHPKIVAGEDPAIRVCITNHVKSSQVWYEDAGCANFLVRSLETGPRGSRGSSYQPFSPFLIVLFVHPVHCSGSVSELEVQVRAAKA